MRIVGIDPGAYGALALLVDGALERVVDMPIVMVRRGKSDKAEVDGYTLGNLLREFAADEACIELVGGITGQSASAAFNFGRSAGAPEFGLKVLGVKIERVAPGVWTRALRVNKGKDGSRSAAMTLWPTQCALFKRKKDDGRAEAALIAHWYWLNRTQGGLAPPAGNVFC